MQARLPPLYALRAFVAAAHGASFARAAEELHVTPAAVSRGVKSLEEHLGVKLFNRMHRKVELTTEGRRYFEELGNVFGRIALATQNLAARTSHRPLRICAYPSFVISWLIPRWCRHLREEFEVQFLTTLSHDVDFEHAEIDAAILTDRAQYPGCRCDLLFTARLVPVCSPDLAADLGPLNTISDLLRHDLLFSHTRPRDWHRWLEANAMGQAEITASRHFESSNLMYEAAKAGLGVAVAIREVVERDLNSGSLVIPFRSHRPAPCPFYLIYPDSHDAHPSLVPFRNWVIAEYHS